jgi:hypothetical protein
MLADLFFRGDWYYFWSGFGNDFPIYVLGVLPVLIGWYRRHNCHVHRCPWIAWAPHPEHGHVVCRRHHPHHRNVTAGGYIRPMRRNR